MGFMDGVGKGRREGHRVGKGMGSLLGMGPVVIQTYYTWWIKSRPTNRLLFFLFFIIILEGQCIKIFALRGSLGPVSALS